MAGQEKSRCPNMLSLVSFAGMTLNKCAVLRIGTLTGDPLCRESHPLCKLKNPTVVYMITCRLSSCKTGVYNVHLLIILERCCSSTCIYRKKERKKREGKSIWPDRDSNSGPFAYHGNTLTTELQSLTVDLRQLPPTSLELLDCPRICSEPCLDRRESPFAICTRSTDPH